MKTVKQSGSNDSHKKSELNQFDLSEWPYNCVCDHLVLVLDVCISTLPLRPKDHSRVFENSHILKIDYDSCKETTYIQRENGIEAQMRLECPKCRLPLFYRHKNNQSITFIMHGSLVCSKESIENLKIVPKPANTQPMPRRATNLPRPQAVPSAYSYNAALITDYLQKKRPSEDIPDIASKKKKHRGTLLDI